jgi:hypothetical protein
MIRWRTKGGSPPADVLAALKEAKPEIIALLGRYALDASGALNGDDLLHRLARLGFRVRRWGNSAALDDDTGQGRVPPMSLLYEFADRQREYAAALRALSARDMSDFNPASHQSIRAVGE